MGEAFAVVEENTRLQNSWYLGAVCEHAQALLTGQLTRIVVTQPPGTLKSMTWCVLFPAWVWVDYPQTRFLIGTHDLSNAGRDAGYCRKVIRSRWYAELFCPQWQLAEDQDAKLFYQTTAGGHRLSVSTGGATAGKKGHVLLLDDIHDAKSVYSKAQRQADKDWFRLGFSDRMMNFKTGVIASIGHRVHKEDLNSELIGEGWPELRLPETMDERVRKTFPVAVKIDGQATREDPRGEGEFLRPDRFGPKERADRIQEGGALTYEAKHQQNPQTRGGEMFDPDMITRVPTYPVGTVAVRYWDTAASESESACATSGVLMGKTPEGRFIVIDVKRGHWNPSERNRIMRNSGLEDMTRPGLRFRRLFWERGTSDSGKERDQLLARSLAGIPCSADKASGPKVVRAEALSSQWEAGNVDVVQDEWTAGYLGRMADFPHASDKDDTDASSGAFNRLALAGDTEEGYATATPEETAVGTVPAGTFTEYGEAGAPDPYA